MAPHVQPLCQLLKPDTKFVWTHQLQSLFEESKDVICSEIEEGVLIFDKTGTVIEVRQFDQYVIRIDVSDRVTLRNRKFLWKYSPVATSTPKYSITDDLVYKSQAQTIRPQNNTTVKLATPTLPAPQPPPDQPHDIPRVNIRTPPPIINYTTPCNAISNHL